MHDDVNPVLDTLGFFAKFPLEVIDSLLNWTVFILAVLAIFAMIRSVWPVSQRVFVMPIAIFGVAWLSRRWIDAGWVLSDWMVVVLVISTLIAVVWMAINLIRFVLGK